MTGYLFKERMFKGWVYKGATLGRSHISYTLEKEMAGGAVSSETERDVEDRSQAQPREEGEEEGEPGPREGRDKDHDDQVRDSHSRDVWGM